MVFENSMCSFFEFMVERVLLIHVNEVLKVVLHLFSIVCGTLGDGSFQFQKLEEVRSLHSNSMVFVHQKIEDWMPTRY
jgi:hypothetical protein